MSHHDYLLYFLYTFISQQCIILILYDFIGRNILTPSSAINDTKFCTLLSCFYSSKPVTESSEPCIRF